MRALVLILVAGCAQYARVASTNAPGKIDIATPPPRETGAADLYVAPEEPGQRSFVGWVDPYFAGGLARHGKGYEFGLEVGYEPGPDRKDAPFSPILSQTWGVATGMGFVQLHDADGGGTDATIGPIYAEARYRRLFFTVGAGPLIYPDEKDAGAQLTFKAVILALRARYVQNTGWEATIGIDIPVFLVFAWSR